MPEFIDDILHSPLLPDWLLVVVAVITGYIAWGALSATERQAGIASDALTKLQRAFVVIESFDWRWYEDKNSGYGRYAVTPVLINAGNTSTVSLSYRFEIVTTEAELPDSFTFPYKRPSFESFIGPQQRLRLNQIDLPENLITDAQSGEVFVYIYGRVEYRDVFEGTPQHVTTFCAQLTNITGTATVPQTIHMIWQIHRIHNSAD